LDDNNNKLKKTLQNREWKKCENLFHLFEILPGSDRMKITIKINDELRGKTRAG
jgi:hypothetical protein